VPFKYSGGTFTGLANNLVFKYLTFQPVQRKIASKKSNRTPLDVSALIENCRASLGTCGNGQTHQGLYRVNSSIGHLRQ
jgi:hypothetical protein